MASLVLGSEKEEVVLVLVLVMWLSPPRPDSVERPGPPFSLAPLRRYLSRRRRTLGRVAFRIATSRIATEKARTYISACRSVHSAKVMMFWETINRPPPIVLQYQCHCMSKDTR